MSRNKPRSPNPDKELTKDGLLSAKSSMNENLRHAVNSLLSTDDWGLDAYDDTAAIMTYSHADPDSARTVKLEVQA